MQVRKWVGYGIEKGSKMRKGANPTMSKHTYEPGAREDIALLILLEACILVLLIGLGVDNTPTSSGTGLSPFQCVYGFQPPLSRSRRGRCPVHWLFYPAFIRQCQSSWRRDGYLSSAKQRHSKAPKYQVGEQVWLSTRDLPLQVKSMKLAPRFVGPFHI